MQAQWGDPLAQRGLVSIPTPVRWAQLYLVDTAPPHTPARPLSPPVRWHSTSPQSVCNARDWHAQVPTFACRPAHIAPDLKFPPHEWWAHVEVDSWFFFGLSPIEPQESKFSQQVLAGELPPDLAPRRCPGYLPRVPSLGEVTTFFWCRSIKVFESLLVWPLPWNQFAMGGPTRG